MHVRLLYANKVQFSSVQFSLSASETGDAIGFRQQLNTTSFEAFELEFTVNYHMHT